MTDLGEENFTKRIVFFPQLVIVLAIILPLVVALRVVITASFPFWYDPARDLLSAWDNLHKLTMIGPTSGIPGIFYGPYWIWLLSFGLLFSKDPRLVDFITATIPYFVLFPLVLWRFRRVFSQAVLILLWILFIFSFIIYATQLWNPYPAPLLTLALISVLAFIRFDKLDRTEYLKLFLSGILAGILCNFHISFGSSTILGSLLFIIIIHSYFLYKTKHKSPAIKNLVVSLLVFVLGIVVIYTPFFIFEMRHQFMQTKTLLHTLSDPYAVVGQQGLSKIQILDQVIIRFATLLEVPQVIALFIFGLLVAFAAFLGIRKKIRLSVDEAKLALLIGCITLTVLAVYLVNKNPIWDYHFIGFEILLLLGMGLLIAKVKALRILFSIWVGIVVLINMGKFVTSFSDNPYAVSSLVTKEHIIDLIASNAGENPYQVFSYSPSIYTYDYDYLMKWKENSAVYHKPDEVQVGNVLYLIIPQTDPAASDDFINYITPITRYNTEKRWKIADGTTILKRIPVKVLVRK